MNAADQLIAKLREEAESLVYSETKALLKRAAQAISDQQDHIDNLERGLLAEKEIARKAISRAENTMNMWRLREPQLYAVERQVEELTAALSSLREDHAMLHKLIEETINP